MIPDPDKSWVELGMIVFGFLALVVFILTLESCLR